MKKVVISSLLLLGIVVRGVALTSNNKNRIYSVKADGPISGTVTTDFKNDWDSSEATPDLNYYKIFADGTSLPLYYEGDETASFSCTIHKNSATENVKLRNYHNDCVNYYAYIKYNSSKTANVLGAYIDFEAKGTYKFNSISSFLYIGNTELRIFHSDDGTNWTQYDYSVSSTNTSFSYDLPSEVSYLRIGHVCSAQGTGNWLAIKNVSLGFSDPANSKTVTFDSQGGTTVEAQVVATNSCATAPADPTRAQVGSTAYVFNGWHTDPVDDTPFNFSSPITEDIILYAHWTENVLTGYTITYNSRGGTAVSPETVPIDGESKFTKPANPTRASDSYYSYTFKDWYSDEELTTKFDFTKVPTSDVTVYAGYGRQGFAPSGYQTIDPKRNIANWGGSSSEYHDLDIMTRDTLDDKKSFPAMHWTVTGSGDTNSGLKNTSNFIINSADMVMTITDPSKYFSALRIEFYVMTYSSSTVKEITIKSNGSAVSDTGIIPHDSLTHSSLVLDVDCSSKLTEVYFHMHYMSSSGTRLRYIYATFGTFTDIEMSYNYAKQFNGAKVCGSSSSDGLNTSKWTEQATIFATYPDSVQSALCNYEGDDSAILEFLERYDRVVYLHGEDYDFMGRVAAGKVTPKSNVDLLLINNVTKNNSLFVIAVISLVSLSAISLYVVCKRRKEE